MNDEVVSLFSPSKKNKTKQNKTNIIIKLTLEIICASRYYSIVSGSLVPAPHQSNSSSPSLGCLLDWSCWWAPSQRFQSLLWHGNWWRRLDASVELFFHQLQLFHRKFQRSDTQTQLECKSWSRCSHLFWPSITRNRLQRHELLILETTRQTGPHQEQHKQLAGVSSGNWQLGRLAGWWHQLSDHQICDCHVQRDTCTFSIKSEYRQWTEIPKHQLVLLFRRLHQAFLANSWSMRTKLVQPFERRGWPSWKHFHSLVNEL